MIGARLVHRFTRVGRPWGPDVSHYQGDVNWQEVKNAGASFAFIKCSEGTSVDSMFKTNWRSLRKYGLVCGAYHYGILGGSPEAQAREYLDHVFDAGGFQRGDFAILDMEDIKSKHLPQTQVRAWVRAWVDTVVMLTGLPDARIIIYTGMWWWQPYTGSYDMKADGYDCPLWLSGYTALPPKVNGWRTFRWWQFTNHRTVPGINRPCDASVFNGNLAALRRLSGLPPR